MATEDRVTNMSTRLEALVTEPQHTSNPGDTVAIKSSDMSTGTSPECLLAKAKRREIDKDIFIDVVHHTIKTATLHLEARNYAAVQESILTVINLELFPVSICVNVTKYWKYSAYRMSATSMG